MTNLYYVNETDRLATFENWPLSYIDKHIMAKTGLYYLGPEYGDRVKCFVCSIEIYNWEENDDPLNEHKKHSPQCRLISGLPTLNIPINMASFRNLIPLVEEGIITHNVEPVLERHLLSTSISPFPSYDVPFMLYIDDEDDDNEDPLSYDNLLDYEMDRQIDWRYSKYSLEENRIKSFNDWPRGLRQHSKELADAGFFYTGANETVRCFKCRVLCRDWELGEDVWIGHFKLSPKCQYGLLMKPDIFQSSEENEVSVNEEDANVSNNDASVSNNDLNTSIDVNTSNNDANVSNNDTNVSNNDTNVSQDTNVYRDVNTSNNDVEASNNDVNTSSNNDVNTSNNDVNTSNNDENISNQDTDTPNNTNILSIDPNESTLSNQSNEHKNIFREMNSSAQMNSSNHLHSSTNPDALFEIKTSARINTPFKTNNTILTNTFVKSNAEIASGTSTSVFKKEEKDLTLSSLKIRTEIYMCKICYQEESNTAFVPCGHSVACKKCAMAVQMRFGKCSICKKDINKVQPIFFT
ncbi:putative inhibitor of apoptosis protein [Yalta virus]|nr:putative inhibitor of apoptosis protein [Yalta virus]